MKTKNKIHRKNIRVTKAFKDSLAGYANGRDIGEVATKIILWYNIDFNMRDFEEVLFTSIKYSTVQREPLASTGDKSETITIKIDWCDYEVFEANCTKLGIDTSEGIRRVIRQVVDKHQSL